MIGRSPGETGSAFATSSGRPWNERWRWPATIGARPHASCASRVPRCFASSKRIVRLTRSRRPGILPRRMMTGTNVGAIAS